MNNFIEQLFHAVDADRPLLTPSIVDICNIDNYILLELCGGIPISDIENIRMNVEVINSCVYEITIITPFYHIERTINFTDKLIINATMIIYTPNEGIGNNIFYNQVAAAIKHGFKQLRTNPVKGSNFNGYYVWGRFGYSIVPVYLTQYENWCKENDIEYKPLFEILLDTASRRKWIDNGYSWVGEFNLEKGSENRRNYNRYLESKGLSVRV